MTAGPDSDGSEMDASMSGEGDPLASRVGELLLARGERVAVLETTAGGHVSASLVRVPGASGWFERGAVAYSRAAKVEMTGVDPALPDEAGAVSRDVAIALAEGFRAASGATFCVAETGIAGPQTGRRSRKRAGSVFIAVAGPSGTVSRYHELDGSRSEIMAQIAGRCVEFLLEAIEATAG